jgi:hypothetical protein
VALQEPVLSQGTVARSSTADSRRQREAQVRAKKELQIRQARRSAAAFIEYALRNEEDDSVLKNAPFHEEWQETLEEHQRCVIICAIEHAKTQQISVGKVLHLLGNNPEYRGAIISSTAQQAEKILRQIRTEIETNERIREVFPNLVPSTRPADPWHSNQITVQRKTRSKDPSLQVMGLFGPLVGSRLDFIVLDDVLDFENTRTEEQRKKAIEWVDTTVITRMTQRARLMAIGTPWHPDDLLHDLEKRPGFASRRYSAVRNPDDNPKRWEPIWPQQWPLDRLLDRRAITVEGVFVRKYLCRVRIDSSSRFKQVWLDRMCMLGKGRTFLAQAPRAHVRGHKLPCFTGVDLGIGGGPENGRTAIVTVALMPDGRRLIAEIESGHWQAPEIIDRLASVYQRFDSEILVESNGAQQFLIDMCQGRVPVRGQMTTAGNKFHETFGVESLAVELRNGLWIMPSGSDGSKVHDEGRRLMNEMLYFDPELHTGDLLVATWLAREALRRYSQPWVQGQNSQAR